jgi:hypothetical protein
LENWRTLSSWKLVAKMMKRLKEYWKGIQLWFGMRSRLLCEDLEEIYNSASEIRGILDSGI